MTLAEIIPAKELYGAEKAFMAKVFDSYRREFPDSDELTWNLMFIKDARIELAAAIRSQLGRIESDPLVEDSFTVHPVSWQEAIAFKQLELVYRWAYGGEGSLTASLRKEFRDKWKGAVLGLGSLMNPDPVLSSKTLTVRL